MGTQISIKTKHMVSAGWKPVTGIASAFIGVDGNGEEEYEDYEYLTFIKGEYTLRSYVTTCFYADCNEWGKNKSLFQEAGLLDLPHTYS